MRMIWGKHIHYKYGQRLRTRYFVLQDLTDITKTAVLFIILTTVFTGIFSVARNNISRAPHQGNAVMSAQDAPGVSEPTFANSAKTTRTNSSSKDNADDPAVNAGLGAKPAWLYSQLFVDPLNSAAQYLDEHPSVNGSKYIARMAQTPVAQWFGDWNTNTKVDVNTYVSAATAANKVPIVVAYNIPHRDCGGYSIGGASSIDPYTAWVRQVAAGIGNHQAVVVLEPDALGALDCLPPKIRQERIESIAQAVTILKQNVQTYVYIDAGTPVWQPAITMSTRLKAANIAKADGFALNVSYFASTAQNQLYGDQLSALVGYKHYVIDTSRNGGNHQVSGMLCNPSFASFGDTPTTNTGKALNDALLWIKIPWESDGPCNGSPGPGQPYWDYARILAQNAHW